VYGVALTGALPPGLDQVLDEIGWGACGSAQLGFSPESGSLGPCGHRGPSQAYACMLGEKIRPGERPRLGDGLVLVLDPAASAMPTADSSDLRRQDLVVGAHSWSLEPAFRRSRKYPAALAAVRSALK
jgi:hypothetical protein